MEGRSNENPRVLTLWPPGWLNSPVGATEKSRNDETDPEFDILISRADVQGFMGFHEKLRLGCLKALV